MEQKINSIELQVEMIRKGMSITQLAEKSGVGMGTIYKIIKGYAPSRTITDKIAQTLSLSSERFTEIFYPYHLHGM